VAITNATWWFFSAGADIKAFQVASRHQRTSGQAVAFLVSDESALCCTDQLG